MIKHLMIISLALLPMSSKAVAASALHDALKACIENAVSASVAVVDTQGRKDGDAFTLQCDSDRAQTLLDLSMDVASKKGDELNLKKEKRLLVYFGEPHFSYGQCMKYKVSGNAHCAFILKEGGEERAQRFIKGDLPLSELPLNSAFKRKMGVDEDDAKVAEAKDTETTSSDSDSNGQVNSNTKGWYASVSPNNEESGPVYWADTQDAAKEGALRGCKKISKTCATRPAWTDQRDDVFSLMCCQKPRFSCAIGVGSSAEAARQAAKNTFSDDGFSKCEVRKYISARSGEDVKP